jgi:UDP-N-acetylglucosamine--N-acetylmuramyl-(pentapeptide) pyrophosphoryl-undecaprenol N-acetylglucosamine transferase
MLFFCSPIGLGHATRDIAIVKNLNMDNVSLKFVTGSKAHIFVADNGYKSLNVYNPPEFNVKNGLLTNSLTWIIKYFLYYKESKAIARNLIMKDKDRILISDEDFASIAIAEEKKRKRILITDILNTRFTSGLVSIIEKQMNRKLRKMINQCNCVIIPDFGKDIDNLRYVGPIVRKINDSRENLRNKFNFNKKTILVCIGGTNSGKFLIEKVIESFEKIKKRLDVDLVIVSGPSLAIKSSTNFRSLQFVPNLNEYIYACDLVISLAGKSTMDESIVYNTPGIFIPLKNHFEQEEGAKRLGFKFNDIFKLDELI